MTVDEVRKALEEMKPDPHRMSTRSGVEDALVTEGLKVLDDYAEVKAEYEKALKSKNDDDYRAFILRGVKAGEHGEQQINLIAAILRSAGRLS